MLVYCSEQVVSPPPSPTRLLFSSPSNISPTELLIQGFFLFHEFFFSSPTPGDNIIVGSFDRKVAWLDLDLSIRPYKKIKWVLETLSWQNPQILKIKVISFLHLASTSFFFSFDFFFWYPSWQLDTYYSSTLTIKYIIPGLPGPNKTVNTSIVLKFRLFWPREALQPWQL